MAIGYRLRNYEGLRYFFDPDKLGYEVDSLNTDGVTGEVVIPDLIDEYPVVAIGTAAFAGARSINSIVIPTGIVTIGGRAFQRSGVESVSFHEGSRLRSIMESAFSYTGNLQDIVIPASVVSIGYNAFLHSSIESIGFEEDSGLKFMDGAFAGTRNLRSLTIPARVDTISPGAFWNSSVHTVTFSSGEHLKHIERDAFGNARSLRNINLPVGIESIGENAFVGWTLAQTISVPFVSLARADAAWAGGGVPGAWRFGSFAQIVSSISGERLWQFS
ncbi:MAG: leucine-rich repeat domain-containing protein [Treponema sp.]|nr:leucine-rich repeat domain-containing protein [Treponema sp.]